MVSKCEYLGYTYVDESSYNISLIIISFIVLIIALPAALLNGSIFISICKTPRLQVPAYLIIGNMAFTDLISSSFSYTAYAVICIMFFAKEDACSVALIVAPISYFLGFISYQTIVLQAVERYIAIFFPLWYHEKFTNKSALFGILLTWSNSLLSTVLWYTMKNVVVDIYFGATSATELFVVFFCHIRIFIEVKRVQKQMRQQVLGAEERRKLVAESKVVKVTLMILSAFLVCYFAELTMLTLSSTSPLGKAQFGILQYWSWLLSLVNSLVNPIIVLNQLKNLRRSVTFMWARGVCSSIVSPQTEETFTENY